MVLRKNFSRIGQIFMFDLIFSFVILIVFFAISFAYYSDTSDTESLYELNQDIMNRFTTVKINSLNSQEIRDFFKTSRIRNVENRVSQQVVEFYHYGDILSAQNLTRVFVSSYDSRSLFIDVLIKNQTNEFSLYQSTNVRVSFNDSTQSYVTRRSIQSFVNSELIGPYLLEVRVWR